MKKQLLLLSTALLLLIGYANAQTDISVSNKDWKNSIKQERAIKLVNDNPILLNVTKDSLVTEIPVQQDKQQMRRQKIEEKPWYVSRYSATAGGFFPVNNTKVQVEGTANPSGDEIDFENDLGFDSHTNTFLVGGDVHLGKRHRLELYYYRFHKSSSKTLDRDIAFKDTVFAVNSNVSGFFNNDIFRFSYGYAFITNPKVEAGLSFGAHIARTNVGLKATGASLSAEASKDFGFTAPLPDFGIWGGYAFHPKWAVIGEFDYFSLKIGDIKGRILGANVAVKYKALDRLAVTLGYTGFNFRVDVTKERFDGFFKWGYNGPSLSANYLIGVKGKGPGTK